MPHPRRHPSSDLGTRWFRPMLPGCLRSSENPPSGRFRPFSEREEIAIPLGEGIWESAAIARELGSLRLDHLAESCAVNVLNTQAIAPPGLSGHNAQCAC